MSLPGNAKVAVDIGNTAVKWVVHRDDGLPGKYCRVSLAARDWPIRIIESLRHPETPEALRWLISAVNGPACEMLVRRLGKPGQYGSVRVLTHKCIPIDIQVNHPEQVGIDRLLAVWKATRIYPGHCVIVVDMGSAITVDLGTPGPCFLGGVIMPGLRLQVDSLARGTDALPDIDLDDHHLGQLVIPAKDTVSAIRNGVLLGTAAAIDGLISRSVSNRRTDEHDRPDHPVKIVLTGGDADRLSSLLTHEHVVCNRLIIDALLDDQIRDAIDSSRSIAPNKETDS